MALSLFVASPQFLDMMDDAEDKVFVELQRQMREHPDTIEALYGDEKREKDEN